MLKLTKKAAKRKQLKLGVKEVLKAVRKDVKGCVVSWGASVPCVVGPSGGCCRGWWQAATSAADALGLACADQKRALSAACNFAARPPLPSPAAPACRCTPPFRRRLCIIAGDISPVDVISPLPVLCEEHDIPYIYVPSKEVRAAGRGSAVCVGGGWLCPRVEIGYGLGCGGSAVRVGRGWLWPRV